MVPPPFPCCPVSYELSVAVKENTDRKKKRKRNATVKLSAINTIHVKQQHNIGFFIFKSTLKYMLGNVYVNKIDARQCLYIVSLYCREGFSNSFNFFFVSKGILLRLILKQLERKDFSAEQLPIDTYMLYTM